MSKPAPAVDRQPPSTFASRRAERARRDAERTEPAPVRVPVTLRVGIDAETPEVVRHVSQ